MAEDAEVQTAATPELPGEAAPVAPAVEPAPVVAAAPVAKTPAAPVAKAPKPLKPLKAAKAPAAPKAAAAPKPVAKAKLPRKAAKAPAPVKAPAAAKAAAPAAVKAPRRKYTRSSLPAASPAPQAAAASLASPKVAPRIAKPRQTSKIGQGKPKLVPMKDLFMATPFDLSQFKTAFADIQDKAKAALEKSTAAIGDASAFTKGNVEAVVESGKILSAGLQDLGTTFVAETRGAFEDLTADAKELAAAKSPTEFFQLQSALARKQFDGVVAQASKSTEAWLKLANEAFAPLSGRVTLAVEKVSKAA